MNSVRAATVTADYLGHGWTPESVAAAVKVSPLEETNAIEIVARSTDKEEAAKLAEGYANATMADRWMSISAELDHRIAAIDQEIRSRPPVNDNQSPDSFSDDASARLQVLKMVRAVGSDPTMKMDSTTLATPTQQMPVWLVFGLAVGGGLFVGLLVAAGMALLRRPIQEKSEDLGLVSSHG
jgi:hypothetical protein